MFIDENKAASLARLLTGFDSVILDTCSLMEDSFPEWLDVYNQAKGYLDDNFVITVPEAAIAELKKHSHDRRNPDKRIPAMRALKIFKEAKRLKLLCVGKKNHNQNFADNAIYSQVCEDRLTQKILVITQDKKLATDLKNLNNLNSQRGKRVSVYKVVSGGKLELNQGEEIFGYQRKHDRNEKRSYEKKPFFAEKTTQKQPFLNPKPDLESDLGASPILAADQRLNANLKNPNYPVESKLADIQKQLALLEGLPENEKNGLHLLQGEKKLKESLVLLSGDQEPKEEAKAEEMEKPLPDSPKVEPSVKETPTVLMKAPAKKLWYGEGKSLSYALSMVAEHYGVLFRDPTIPYVSVVHGPLDLTSKDQSEIIALLDEKLRKGNSAEANFPTFRISAEKGERGYKVYLDLNPVSLVDPSTNKGKEALPEKAEPNPAPQIDASESPAVEKAENPAAEVAPETPSTIAKKDGAPKQDATSAVKAVPNTSAAVPAGVTLVIGVPTDERKKGWIERSARRDAMGIPSEKKKASSKKKPAPSKEAKATKRASAKETKPEPVKKAKTPKSEKPTSGKKPKAQAEPLKKETKTKHSPKGKSVVKKEGVADKNPAKPTQKSPKAPKKASSPNKPAPAKPDKPGKPVKKTGKAVQGTQKRDPLDEALKGEKKLKANLNNPNYPASNKKADVANQLRLVQKLPKEAKGKLSISEDALKMMGSLF